MDETQTVALVVKITKIGNSCTALSVLLDGLIEQITDAEDKHTVATLAGVSALLSNLSWDLDRVGTELSDTL